MKTKKVKKMIWKKGQQNLCVLISVNCKTYQVNLKESQRDSIAFILPQLFDDGIIKVMSNVLPITIPPYEKNYN